MKQKSYAHWTYYESPIGWVVISGNGGSVARIAFLEEAPSQFYSPVPKYLQNAAQQLHEYFHHERTEFDIVLDIKAGTEFQQKVWMLLQAIPYARTTSYLKIAEQLGDKNAVRAVGRAASQNPIPIVVPCHRLIGLDGSLTGFAYGIGTKRKLLAIENPKSFGIQQSLF